MVNWEKVLFSCHGIWKFITNGFTDQKLVLQIDFTQAGTFETCRNVKSFGPQPI